MLFEPDETEEKTSQAELEHQDFLDNLRDIAGTHAGKLVLWKILEYAGVHNSSFDLNPQIMSYNEGRREVGLWLEKLLDDINPNLIYDIAKEKANVRTNQ